MANVTKKKDEGIVELVKTLVYALILAGIIRTLFFQPFWIPSGSMKDTLLIGDFLFVNKMAYGYSRHSCPFSMCPFSGRILPGEPERGDVVVFKHPVTQTDFIKRLVGLPGDSVQMVDGRLVINGAPVVVEPDGQFVEPMGQQGPMRNTPRCSNGAPRPGEDCIKTRARETLPNGVTHSILDIGAFPGSFTSDNTPVMTVPEGHYFMMGDNRDNSADSRFPQRAGGVGFVPFENFIGRADRIMFSSAGRSILAFWTWRSDRYFKAIE